MRTAHKYKNIGIKVSAVALNGEDWRHFNEDDYEGQANVEREAYEGNTLDPHNLDGIGGP